VLAVEKGKNAGGGDIPPVQQSWQCSKESSADHCQHAAALQSQSHRYVVIPELLVRQHTADLTASGHDELPD